jgi:hypothetical protein
MIGIDFFVFLFLKDMNPKFPISCMSGVGIKIILKVCVELEPR